MNKNKNKIITFTLFILVSISIVIFLTPRYFRSISTIFYYKDKAGDDYREGKVKYPTNKLFEEKNLFDILEFRVENDIKNNNYIFIYKMNNLKNSLNYPNGFTYPIIDTYISMPNQKGMKHLLQYGAAIQFDEKNPWVYHIRVSPKQSYIQRLENYNGEVNIKDIMKKINFQPTKVRVQNNTIYVYINKDLFDGKKNSINKMLGTTLRYAKYYVFSGSYDELGPDNYRLVNKEESEFFLSGGRNEYYDSNILDILHPQQEELLKPIATIGYNTIIPIYNINTQNYILTDYVVFVLMFIYLIYIIKITKKEE